MKLISAFLEQDPFVSLVFFPLRLLAISFNIYGILDGIPYSHDDEAAEIISKAVFPKEWIQRGDARLRKRRGETKQRLDALLRQIGGN